ncbi:MAG: hypothetical protein ACXAAH_13615 [Promethearchaeota archaeon]|jgi:hypothetical protein
MSIDKQLEFDFEKKKKSTSFLTAGSNGGIDDEYYIDEIIGIEQLSYKDYVEETDED